MSGSADLGLVALLDEVRAARMSPDEAAEAARTVVLRAAVTQAPALPVWQELMDLAADVAASPSAMEVDSLVPIVLAAADPLTDAATAAVVTLLAARLFELGAKPRAAELAEMALRVGGNESRYRVEAACIRAAALLDLGDAACADALMKDAVVWAEGDEPDIEAWAWLTRAETRLARGEDDRRVAVAQAVAAVDARAAHPCGRTLGPSVCRFAYQAGLLAGRAGEFEESVTLFERARQFAFDADDPVSAAWMLSEIGFAWQHMGEIERSRELLRRAADEAEQAGEISLALRWRGRGMVDLADDDPRYLLEAGVELAEDPNRLEEAVVKLRKAVAWARDGQRITEAAARNALGAVLERQGRFDQALAAYIAARRCAQRDGDRPIELIIQSNIATVHLARVQFAEALEALNSAVTLGEDVKESAVSSEFRQAAMCQLVPLYNRMVFMGALQTVPVPPSTAPGREPDPALVSAASQRLRASNLLRALVLGGRLEDRADPAIADAAMELRAAEVCIEVAALEGRPLGALIEQRAQRAGALHDLGVPDQVAMMQPESIEDLAASLQRDEVLLDLVAVPEGVAAVCVPSTADARVTFVSWNARSRRAHARALRRERREALFAERSGEDPTPLFAPVVREFRLRLFGELVELIASAAAGSGNVVRHVLVAPHAELFEMPWWPLADELGAAISLLPHPQAIRILRDRPREAARPLLLVRDPTGTMTFSAVDLHRRTVDIDCPADPNSLWLELPRAGTLHIACHGVFDSSNVYRSGLLVQASPAGTHDELGAPSPDGDPRHTVLTVAQLAARLRLPRCRLAVLAACDSGLPRDHVAGEFTSLPAAFLVAGARNVVASLWPAHDGAAALLMQLLHAALDDGSGASVAECLARARRQLAAMTRDEAVERLGTADGLRGVESPFAAGIHTDVFQHYGVD